MASKKKESGKAPSARTAARRQLLQDFMRTEIYNAVVAAVEKAGWNVISMDEIASEIGGSKGTIYYYFKSKNDLMLDMWLYLQKKMARELTPVFDDPTLKPREKLEKFIYTWVRQQCIEWRMFKAVWTNSLSIIKWDESTDKELMDNRNRDVKIFIKLISAVNPEMKKNTRLADFVARAVVHALDSVSVIYREPFVLTPEETAARVAAMLTEGLCPRENGKLFRENLSAPGG